jgi:hypothetical protein
VDGGDPEHDPERVGEGVADRRLGAAAGVLVPTPAKAPPWKAAEMSSSRPSRTVPAPTTTSTSAEPAIGGSWRRKVRMRIEPEDSPTV